MNALTTTGAVRRVPIPPGQDPFVNTPLISLGIDDTGTERFWTSSWNANAGATGVVVDESGDFTVHRFDPPHFGFYSAVAEDPDTLWLCGDLSRVVRYQLSTGQLESYDTGAPAALVFSGMTWDPVHRKLFAAAFPPPHRIGFSFDTVARRTTKLYTDFVEEHYQCANFDNGDGTHTSLMINPGLAMIHWDPATDEIDVTQARDLRPDLPHPIGNRPGTRQLEPGPDGRFLLNGVGWFDPTTRSFGHGPTPERDLQWFAFRGDRAWGCQQREADAVVSVWDLGTGEVRELCTIPDANAYGIRLTASGVLVSVSVYGEFSRFDADTGERHLVRQLPTDSVARVDCLRRIDRQRVLGTPFITQRFWTVDLDTGDGADLGRAAPGGGEILRTWQIDGIVYLAAYAGGELTAYDPSQPSDFPTNPRVVADPGNGMRPIASAEAGSVLYYASSHHYGELGGVITRYDTATGEATYRDEPLPDLAIQSLVLDPASGTLLAGSTIEADCQSATPRAAAAALARLDPVTMDPLVIAPLPPGVAAVRAVADLGGGRVLCTATRPGEDRVCGFVVSVADLVVPAPESWIPLPDGPGDWPAALSAQSTGRPGLVVLAHGEGRWSTWHVDSDTAPEVLHHEPGAYHLEVQDGDVLIATGSEIVVLEGIAGPT
ncbi:hypothetical protein ACQBAU_08510 [Propionibacteriaceae bacterium Y2011]